MLMTVPQRARARARGDARDFADNARDFADYARDYVRRRPRASEAELRHVEQLADMLDTRFRFLGIRFGWDAILGLVPGIGDLAAFGVSAYIILQAHRLGARKRTIARMLTNAGVDTVFGSVPVLGSLFDIGFKANRRNVRLLQRELAERASAAARMR
jgi:hypothetical protein